MEEQTSKTLFVGQGINANNQVISNVTAPNTLLDVANKWYVDNKTVGNVNGNFYTRSNHSS
jgi:hypothetical protein